MIDLTKLCALIAARDAAESDFETKGAAAHYVSAVEASKALKDWLGSNVLAILEHIERVERNRDMWKGQCKRQAEALTKASERPAELLDDLREVAKAITNGAQDTLWMGDGIADPTIVDFICNITGDDPSFIGSWERATIKLEPTP
jgi:hypothetical protein